MENIKKIDIIGGSVAGLEVARHLEGYEVTVYEEHDEIGRPLQCAEGFFEHHGISAPDDALKVEEVIFRLVDPSFVTKDMVSFKPWNLYFIDRPTFEKRLAKLAEEAGAKIVTGRKVKIADLDADIIVDASGHPSQWDREHGIRRKGAVAVQAVARLDIDGRDEPVMIFDWHPGFDGYYWVFSKGNGLANVGVGYYKQPLKKMKKRLESYLEFLGAEAIEWTGGSIGAGLFRPFLRICTCKNCRGKKVALVGDAAGLADTLFVEGMTNAIISARVLADSISRPDRYERELMRRLGFHYRILAFGYWLKHNHPRAMMVLAKLMAKLFKIYTG